MSGIIEIIKFRDLFQLKGVADVKAIRINVFEVGIVFSYH